jgi:hypothetical protein
MLIGVGLQAFYPSIPRAWGGALIVVGVILLADTCRRAARGRRFSQGPELLVTHGGQSREETLTFSVPPGGHEIANLIVEPSPRGHQVVIDPSEILFVHVGQPSTCSVCVREADHSIWSLANFLERKQGEMEVWVRFTDSAGKRKRTAFHVEIMGSDHRVEWVPGRVESA